MRRVGGDGRRLRRPLLGGPRDEGDDVGAGHAGLHGLPGHVRARDTHGREGFGGVDRRVDVFYDARGRTACESEPYHAGETARYARYTYETRDRLKVATRPDGGVTGIVYTAAPNQVTATVTETVKASDGTTTKATRKTKRAHNVLGELVSTTEGAEQTHTAEEPRHVTTSYVYHGAGRLKTVTTGGQTTTFKYDAAGGLTRATTHISDSATASRTLAFDYDPRGNLKTKTSDVPADDSVANVYPTTSNRLTSATIGDVPYEFPHDTSGRIERYDCTDDDEDDVDDCAGVDDTFIDWNARGLAQKVTVGESKTDAMPEARDSFRHGPDGARYFKKSEWAVESGATTTMKTSRKYYAGAYEKTVTVGGETVERTRIGDSVVHVRTTPASMMATETSVFEYVHRDHLGSVEAVTNEAGAELVVLGHDPHGERRKNDWTARLTRAEIETLLGGHGERVSRGFTGHEHLDRTGLVHMNGRVYDPRLGRFLSPDPIVGDPTSSQSWNLYSYVGNNPLSYVDPTGLVQAGPCSALNSGCMHLDGGGSGGGSTTRTVTVTTTETVHGVMAIPYRYAVPVWTRVGGSAWPGGNDFVYDVSYDYFWGVDYQPYSYTHNVTRTIALEDHSVADEPTDSEILQGMFVRGEISEDEYWMSVDPSLDSVADPVELLLPPWGFGSLRNVLRNPKVWLRSLFGRSGGIAESVRLGKIGEARLNRTGGTPQVRLPTSMGPRVVDNVLNRIGRESKVGRAALTSSIRRQIAKDVELVKEGALRGYEWHFYRGKTGVGPTRPLRAELERAGIKIVEYP